jgi:HlyD family secretion protein
LFLAAIIKTLTIPQIAIIYDSDESYVYRVIANKAIKTKVTLGERNNENIVVTSGLQANDTIITANQINLTDGAIIKTSP